jgi:hypothetical protein
MNITKSARVTTPSPLMIHPMRRMGKRSRSGFSYDPDSPDLDCPISPSLMIHRLAWRLVFLAAEKAMQCDAKARRQEAESDRNHCPRGEFLE